MKDRKLTINFNKKGKNIIALSYKEISIITDKDVEYRVHIKM